MSVSQLARPTAKECGKCNLVKPLDEFYENPNGALGRMPYCKKCDNSRKRKPSVLKLARNRARNRAVADLIAARPDEFQAFMEKRLVEALEEADALAATEAAGKHFKNEPVRLLPGKRMAGEKAGDRIDVARCPHCIKHHDAGHVCARCGMAPAAALKIKDDGHLDDIAVERAMNGDPVRLTPPEQIEVIRRLADRGLSDAEIADRLHISDRTIERKRKEHKIESRWTA